MSYAGPALLIIPLLYVVLIAVGAFALYLAVRFGVRHGIRDAGTPGPLRRPDTPADT